MLGVSGLRQGVQGPGAWLEGRGWRLRLRARPGPVCRVSGVGGVRAWGCVLQAARGQALSCLCFSTPTAGGSVDLGSSLRGTDHPNSPRGDTEMNKTCLPDVLWQGGQMPRKNPCRQRGYGQ